ncbi:hypothetical protein C6501_02875 [Candidatus Poribacteria bacterium]|nr:MAG: hypothetical protein C6501_02875 [Candidatus Poribacteria bacterium]
MLSEYQPVFKYKMNFNHFRTYVKGLIRTPHRGTMTQIYLSTKPETTYWSLPKFLDCSKWCVDELTSVLTILSKIIDQDSDFQQNSERQEGGQAIFNTCLEVLKG